MKKTRNILVLTLALLSIVSMGSVAGTYAKYTTSKTSSDQARVAKWGINITNDIDLFSASYLINGTDTDVVSSNGDNVVAPGTNGEYSFVLSGAPETNYTLAVEAVVTDTIGRIVYALDDNDGLTALELQNALNNLYKDQVYAANTTSESTHKISWKWVFEDGQDVTDTTLADKETLDTVNIQVKITATQSEAAQTATNVD